MVQISAGLFNGYFPGILSHRGAHYYADIPETRNIVRVRFSDIRIVFQYSALLPPFPPVGILVFSINPVAGDCRKCQKCHTCTRAARDASGAQDATREMYSGILLLMGMSALMVLPWEIVERVLCRCGGMERSGVRPDVSTSVYTGDPPQKGNSSKSDKTMHRNHEKDRG